MNLYLLEQTENNGFDTYDSCVVVASNPEQAARILPEGHLGATWDGKWPSWASKPGNVTVTYLGTASFDTLTNNTVICSSFNAG